MTDYDAERQQLIVFKLEDKLYGVDIGQIREITRVSEISPVPNSPGYVLGVTNLRGQVTTVIDLRRRLGMPPKDFDKQSRMMVIECEGVPEGIVIDAVAEVTMLPKADIEETPEIVRNGRESDYIKGIGKKDGKLIILVDIHKVLSTHGSVEFAVTEPEKEEVKTPVIRRK